MTGLDLGTLRVVPLSSAHDRAEFACGNPALDTYFRKQASQDVKRRLAAPFVALTPDDRIIGFYTLATASIRLAALPPELARKLPHYPAIPAVLLGRLAVDQTMQGLGVGAHLLADALFRAVRSEISAYAMVVDPIDDAARRFYEGFGFLPLLDDGDRLYRRLAEVAALLKPPAEPALPPPSCPPRC